MPEPDHIHSFVKSWVDKDGVEYKMSAYIGIIGKYFWGTACLIQKYYLDYLTSFGLQKKFEERFKGAYAKNISWVSPDRYADRFTGFMNKAFDLLSNRNINFKEFL